jgi:hypothetical protein
LYRKKCSRGRALRIYSANLDNWVERDVGDVTLWNLFTLTKLGSTKIKKNEQMLWNTPIRGTLSAPILLVNHAKALTVTKEGIPF